jgi:hypothetical protein
VKEEDAAALLQANELRGLVERAVLAYALVDWGGSMRSFERSHNAFKAAMRELEECVKKDGGGS